jgi:hypothetical protein
MGKIGVTVWIFRGELEPGQWSPPNIKLQSERNQGGGAPDNRPERGGPRTGRKPRKPGG